MNDLLIEQVKVFCPYCHRDVAISWIRFDNDGGGITKYLTKVNYFSNKNGIWALGECPSCEKCIMIHLNEDRYGKLNVAEIFPYPLPTPTDERIPEKIRKDLDEAKICFSVNGFRGCAIMCRRALQVACKIKGATKKDLIDQINELAEKRIITNDLKELSHAIRWIGNDAAHPNEGEVVEEDAKEILNLTEQFMQIVFVAPLKVKEIREKQEKRKQNARET